MSVILRELPVPVGVGNSWTATAPWTPAKAPVAPTIVPVKRLLPELGASAEAGADAKSATIVAAVTASEPSTAAQAARAPRPHRLW